MGIKYQGFQSILYCKFIIEEVYKVEPVAKAMGIPPSTLYNYIEGISYFPPDLIGSLYNATRDNDFYNFIVKDTDQRMAPRENPAKLKSPLEETLDVAASAGDLVSKVRAALEDENIDEVERQRILKAISGTHKELEELSTCVKKAD